MTIKSKGSGDRQFFSRWIGSDKLLELLVPWFSYLKISLIVQLSQVSYWIK